MAGCGWNAQSVLLTTMRVREINLEKEKEEIKKLIDESAGLGLMSCTTHFQYKSIICDWLTRLGFHVRELSNEHYTISWRPESVDCGKSDANVHILFEEYD